MKTTNLLWLLALLISGMVFTGCVNEDTSTSYKTSVSSFSFTIQGLASTRSEANVDVEMDDEKNISSLFVGFYDTATGNRITSGYYNSLQFDGKSTYTVEDIIVPEDMKMDVYIIANPPVAETDKNNYNKQASLASLKKTVVAYSSANAFDPTTLIKVGEVKDYNYNNRIPLKVDLVQLAAKVYVELKLEEKENIADIKDWEFIKPNISVANVVINSTLSIDGNVTSPNTNLYTVPEEEAKSLTFSFYTYKKQYVDNNLLTLSISGDLQTKASSLPNQEKKILKNQNYRATINPKDGLLPGNSYHVKGNLKVDPTIGASVQWIVVEIEKITVKVPSFE